MYNTRTTCKLFGAFLALTTCIPAFAQKQDISPAQSASTAFTMLQLELWRPPSQKSPLSANRSNSSESERNKLKEGNPIGLKVSLKNTGKEVLFTNPLELGATLSLLVRDQNGNRVPLTNLGKRFLGADAATAATTRRMTLASGSTTAKCFQVNALYDMSIWGNYTVVATLTFPDGHAMKSKPLPLMVEYATNRLTPEMEEAQEQQTATQEPIN